LKATPEGVAMIDFSGDPWSWPALAELDAEQVHDLFPPGGDPVAARQFFQYFAVQRCNSLKTEIEKTGSGFAVLAAIRECGSCGLAMPEWLVYEFNRRFDTVLNLRSMSWDDPASFGKPYPKGTTQAAKQKARLLEPQVWNAVNLVLKMEPDTAIDKGLFERVGKPLNIGSTLAEKYYYNIKKMMPKVKGSGNSGVHMVIDGFDIRPKQNTAKNTKIRGIQGN
jgi:hypothetical protein